MSEALAGNCITKRITFKHKLLYHDFIKSINLEKVAIYKQYRNQINNEIKNVNKHMLPQHVLRKKPQKSTSGMETTESNVT